MATVLLVDDDSTVRNLATHVLRRAKYDVVCASNGLEALYVYESYANRIDVVITDVDMPEMNGLELAARIRAGHPAAKIVVMSGIPREVSYPFLQKPFRVDALLETVGAAVTTPPR